MDFESRVKILLVDDNEDNLTSMEIVLEMSGYHFFKATSGNDALKILLREDDISLILLDVRMPVMDGYETAELISQREKLKHIPIIFITGHDYEEAGIFKGYQSGAVDYISKPFNPQILRSKVAVFAELYRKNQLLQKQEEKLRVTNEDLMALNRELENRVKSRTLELENLNHELKNLNLSKDKFLTVISHDLRNPLTALLVSSEKLNTSTEDLSITQVKQLSQIILRTSNKILEQLNEVVEWAKIQRDKTSFDPKPIELYQGIDDALELLKHSALQKDIRLLNVTPKDILVNADSLMLRSIVQNIVTNAIKFTPQYGYVRVNAICEDPMVNIVIEDSGIGMSAETQERLFTRNSSASLAGTNNEAGSGLGLLLVQDFVAQHGGVVKVESKEGMGTKFHFSIPRN